MDFKTVVDSINDMACVISVRKTKDGYDEIRIVDGNKKYLESFSNDMYFTKKFIPNMIYTDFIARNLNFEDYCYRSAVKKELLHSYAYPEYFKAWMHMLFIPLEYETEELSYCLYIMEMNIVFNPENLSNTSNDIDNKVLKATLELANAGDFLMSLKNVTREIRKICNATFCCILLVDDVKKELNVIAEDRDLNSDRKAMAEYMDEFFYDLVKTWDDTIGNNNCLLIFDEKGMDFVKEKNNRWYQTFITHGIDSLVLFRLKTGNNQIGYMWVSDFKADDTTKIKEALEITTFILGFEIGNYLLMNQLTVLSSIDVLTGLYNRNKMNTYMDEIEKTKSKLGVVFLDINGLKKVNDVLGHLKGDALIKRAAHTLKSVFDTIPIFRSGGDEFIIILDDISEEEIIHYIERIKEESMKNDISFAVGYSLKKSRKDVLKALKDADENMYIDKREHYKSIR
jgi:diguanylate cyclase (GGDEF)-like protein